MGNDSTIKTITVAGLLCIVCSVLVSTAAVKLKPIQELNRKLDIKKKLLLTAGLLENPKAKKKEVEKAFENVEAKIVDLETGRAVSGVDIDSFNQKKAAKDPKKSKMIDGKMDIAKIKRRSKLAKVYFIKSGNQVEQIVLPVHGKGLWSTMYGFISLKPDTKTINGFGFYSHGETPGLGGEVDNPRWKAVWKGKMALNDQYAPSIKVIKGAVDPNSAMAKYQVDGLSGATITSVGVQHLVNYWLGEDGFSAFLANFRNGSVQ